MGNTALAPQEAVTATPAHTPKYRRLKDTDKAFALRYHAEGLTQVQIAQRLGCDQSAISRWLSECNDTTIEASAYFRGKALPMAEKIVKRGRPADLIKALQGVGVLQSDQPSAQMAVFIGQPGQAVPMANPFTFAPVIASAERRSVESLVIQDGSDNPSSVNQPLSSVVNNLQHVVDYGKGEPR